ncbi:hypothetical protein NDU88_003256 [Pleurodeles waltl]|uniref:Secreted protein n=1 Tax=Pleurodeles waltl TaxID=8319 RepID=A0AAV7M5P0_PLEWA|nr:hypothetical protein NDU88_003256 [Pleurodeles waltl]
MMGPPLFLAPQLSLPLPSLGAQLACTPSATAYQMQGVGMEGGRRWSSTTRHPIVPFSHQSSARGPATALAQAPSRGSRLPARHGASRRADKLHPLTQLRFGAPDLVFYCGRQQSSEKTLLLGAPYCLF